MIRILKCGEVADGDILARAIPAADVGDVVAEIIADVRENGDAALKKYTEKFDGARLEALAVTPAEIEAAVAQVAPEFIGILEKAAGNIRAFHSRQLRNGFIINDEPGVVVGQKVIPMDRAGVYVPGGTAAYPSSVLMNAIPARIAGGGEQRICLLLHQQIT